MIIIHKMGLAHQHHFFLLLIVYVFVTVGRSVDLSDDEDGDTWQGSGSGVEYTPGSSDATSTPLVSSTSQAPGKPQGQDRTLYICIGAVVLGVVFVTMATVILIKFIKRKRRQDPRMLHPSSDETKLGETLSNVYVNVAVTKPVKQKPEDGSLTPMHGQSNNLYMVSNLQRRL